MDPVGLTLGVVSLAASATGTFTSIVQCFEYVELGRRFGKDFTKSQAQLDALKLQVTRWGIAAGILPDPRTGLRQSVVVDSVTERTVENLLSSILEDIGEVEHKSNKYRAQNASAGADLEVFGPSDMDESTQALSARTKTIWAKRTKAVSWVKRTKWAVYEKKYFDRLLEDISGNLGHLEKLSQPIVDSQQDLCRVEVEEVGDGQSDAVLQLLHDASQSNGDGLLEQALREAIAARGCGHRWERTEVGDNVKLAQGDRIASDFKGHAPLGRLGHNYGVTIGKGKSEIIQGDMYGTIERS
ncbi:prion-inhibition and propagation-domain-containing protein [Ilyonectria destructans]|nr:prion-inhibition and propagation-domain-containing protein [Ilyonectria destructans]